MNIKQLRQTILDRAIRGQLVSQDPTDEPASVLLERIRAEKEELIKEKKLKREKRDSQPIKEVPFEIPEGWVWCRLGDISLINPKNNLNDELDVSFIPMTLISEGFSNVHTSEVKKWKNIKERYTHFCNEDIGIAKITPCFENRKSVIFNNLKNGVGAGTTELYILRNNKTISFNKYLFWVVKTQEFINKGIESFTGAVGQQRVSKDFIENTLIPLPPLAEQHRIVQKIEQLFALVDIIEVNKKALEKLIEQAKSQVLSDAVAGKLTHQDPNDEPAEELLKRMGKTTAPDTPYEKMLPKGWAWCKLGEVCSFENGYAFNSNDYQKKGIPLIRISNIKDGEIDISKAVYIEAEYDKRFIIEYGDLLIAMSGATTGKMGVYKLDRKALLNQRVGNIKVKNKDVCFSEFRDYFMQTKSNEILKMAYGGAQPNIRGKMIKNLSFPLPPLKEQNRIVQKIESYFTFFDVIRSNL